MTLHDLQQLAFLLKNAEPGDYAGPAAHAAWTGICSEVAEGLRKHKLVSDHQFEEAMFLDAALGRGDYDPEYEDDDS